MLGEPPIPPLSFGQLCLESPSFNRPLGLEAEALVGFGARTLRGPSPAAVHSSTGAGAADEDGADDSRLFLICSAPSR